MGISLTLTCASDQELASFCQDTVALHRALTGSGRQSCYLSGSWRDLDALLTQALPQSVLPHAALTLGEHTYPSAEDRVHSLSSARVTALARVLPQFGEPELAAFVASQRSDLSHDVDELAYYLRKLQAFVQDAARAGSGLLFCFWEDW